VYAENYSGDRYTVFTRFAELASLEVAPVEESNFIGRELAKEYTRLCEHAVSVCAEIPGASLLLSELLQNGFLLAINSATPTATLQDIVAKRGWSEFFSEVLGAPASKAENLASIAEKFGLAQSEIIMVGDRLADLVGAQDFGCHFIGLIQPDSDFIEPLQFGVSNMSQFLKVLNKIKTLKV
jgi:phosphoglycolate phosphatase-like HAD superfamily hydrolase